MSGSLCIRTATPDKAEVLLEIQKASSVAGFCHVSPPDKYPFPSEAVLDRWQKAVDDPVEVVVLAELDGAAVGFAAMRADWLDALYVAPSCWGVGVGARLHDHALTWIRDVGCQSCHLWVLEQNARARRFYEKRGWRLNGDTRLVPFPRIPPTSDTRSSCRHAARLKHVLVWSSPAGTSSLREPALTGHTQLPAGTACVVCVWSRCRPVGQLRVRQLRQDTSRRMAKAPSRS